MTDHPYPRERTWSDCEAELEQLRALLREWLVGDEAGADTYERRVREALGDVPDA